VGCKTSKSVEPANGLRRANSLYIISTPREKTSLRASSAFLEACSGDL
jgi:hypothetical protein